MDFLDQSYTIFPSSHLFFTTFWKSSFVYIMFPHFYDIFSFSYSIFSFQTPSWSLFLLESFLFLFYGHSPQHWWKFWSLLPLLTKFCFLQVSTFSHLRFPIIWGWFLTLNVYNWNLSLFVHEPPLSLQLGSHEPQYPTKRMNWGEELMYTWCSLSSRTALSAPHLTSAFGSAWNCYMGFQRAQWLISWW